MDGGGSPARLLGESTADARKNMYKNSRQKVMTCENEYSENVREGKSMLEEKGKRKKVQVEGS